jgi:hypothetical protein
MRLRRTGETIAFSVFGSKQLMSTCMGTGLMDLLGRVPDPRVKRTQRHESLDILVIALCATIGGADDWVSVVQFGKAKKDWSRAWWPLMAKACAADATASSPRCIS